MKKRLKSLFVTLAMMIAILTAAAVPVRAETTGNGTENDPWVVNTWTDLKEKMSTGGYIQLGDSVTDEEKSSTSYLSVPSGVTVTFDLNGKTIDRGLANSTAIQ